MFFSRCPLFLRSIYSPHYSSAFLYIPQFCLRVVLTCVVNPGTISVFHLAVSYGMVIISVFIRLKRDVPKHEGTIQSGILDKYINIDRYSPTSKY